MNLKHRQLDPNVNRSRIIPGSAATVDRVPHQLVQPKADPENPYINTHLGLFTGVVQDENNAERPYAFYIPTTMKTSGSMVLIMIPGGEDPVAFFEKCAWKESLERHAVTGYFVGAPKGWDLENPGMEIDVAVKVLAEMKSMEYFPCNAPSVYCLGFGDGAKIAAIFSMEYISYLAGWGAWGDTSLDPALVAQIGNGPSDCDASLRRADIALPTFVIGKDSNMVSFFKAACRVNEEEYLYNGFARVFREVPRPGASFINDEACSEVWLGDEADAAKLGKDVMIEKMVAFVAGYQRWAGEGNHYIRRTRLAERDLHMKKTEMMINGLKRYWYTFEPSAYKRGLKDKYPLVIAIHGFSCSGEFFAQNSGWHRVGEERSAFVVYPTAYPYYTKPNPARKSPMSTGIATPHWNSGGLYALDTDNDGPDDVDFIRQMLADVMSKYPIDPERVYVTGHSNGSMMTQRIMRMMPEKFAGFAPVGAMECILQRTEAPKDGIKRNVWYTMGEFDGLGCSLEGDNANTRTLAMICEANGMDATKQKHYTTGIYMNTIIRDENAVPMVRFTGVSNWPHTYSPELAFMIYDEFFSRFVRHSDGTLEYLA